MEELKKQMQLLLDKEEIKQLQINYGRYCDMHDYEKFESVFADVITIDFTSFDPSMKWVNVPRADYKNQVGGFMGNLTTQHVFTSFSIEVDGDTATCSSYLRAMHYREGNFRGDNLQESAARYDIKCVRTPDGWKIKEMVPEFIWFKGNFALFS